MKNCSCLIECNYSHKFSKQIVVKNAKKPFNQFKSQAISELNYLKNCFCLEKRNLFTNIKIGTINTTLKKLNTIRNNVNVELFLITKSLRPFFLSTIFPFDL